MRRRNSLSLFLLAATLSALWATPRAIAKTYAPALAVSPSGRYVAVGYSGDKKGIQVWDNRLKNRTELIALEGVARARFTDDHTLYVITNGNGQSSIEHDPTYLWKITPGKEPAKIFALTEKKARVVGFSDDGSLFVIQVGGQIEVHATSDGKLVTEIEFTSELQQPRVAFTDDNSRLALGTTLRWGKESIQYEQGDILIYDVKTGKLLNTLNNGAGFIYALAFAPNGSLAATRHNLLDFFSPKLERTKVFTIGEYAQGFFASLYQSALSPDGQLLFTSTDKEVTVHEIATWKSVVTLEVKDRSYHDHLELSPDGSTLFYTEGQDTARRASLFDGIARRGGVKALWAELSDEAPEVGYGVLVTLSRTDPKDWLPLAQETLGSTIMDEETEKKVTKLIKDLDSDNFDERQTATRDLPALAKKYGLQALLEETLKKTDSLEVRWRIRDKILPEIRGLAATASVRISRTLALLHRTRHTAAVNEWLTKLSKAKDTDLGRFAVATLRPIERAKAKGPAWELK